MKKDNFLLYISLHIMNSYKNLRNNSHFARSSLLLEYLIMTPEAKTGDSRVLWSRDGYEVCLKNSNRICANQRSKNFIQIMYIEEND